MFMLNKLFESESESESVKIVHTNLFAQYILYRKLHKLATTNGSFF